MTTNTIPHHIFLCHPVQQSTCRQNETMCDKLLRDLLPRVVPDQPPPSFKDKPGPPHLSIKFIRVANACSHILIANDQTSLHKNAVQTT